MRLTEDELATIRSAVRAQLDPKADGSFWALHGPMEKQGIVTSTA